MITLAAYSHFGASGLKGLEMYHLVRDVWRRGRLDRVIAVSRKRCAYAFDRALIRTLPGEGRLLHALAAIERRWPAFPSRLVGEVVFDHFAAARLSGAERVVVTTQGMPRTAARARARRVPTVLYGATADPRFMRRTIGAERHRLGVTARDGSRPRVLARLVTHVESSDYLLALSDFVTRTHVAEGFPAHRVFVAPLGVDLARFRPVPPPADGPLTFLFVGHVNLTSGLLKGLQYLLPAWAEADVPEARLRIAGKMGAEAREVIGRFPGLRNVEFVGHVGDPAALYRAAHVLVVPSLSEGLAKVMLEGMASGRPVILTPNTGAAARDGVDGRYVPAGDAAALAAALRDLARDRKALACMGANARARAEAFTWDAFSARVDRVLQQVAA